MAKRIKGDDYWIPLADLMTGLMLIFLLIAAAAIRNSHETASDYVHKKQDIYKSLKMEFSEKELHDWGAEIIESPTLSVRFKNPEVLFASGKSDLQPKFEIILAQFFPRYLKLVIKIMNQWYLICKLRDILQVFGVVLVISMMLSLIT